MLQMYRVQHQIKIGQLPRWDTPRNWSLVAIFDHLLATTCAIPFVMKHRSRLDLRIVSCGAIGIWLLGALNACASSSQRVIAEPPVEPPGAVMAKPFAVTEPWSQLTTEPYKGSAACPLTHRSQHPRRTLA
jgi:hypothetical protein